MSNALNTNINNRTVFCPTCGKSIFPVSIEEVSGEHNLYDKIENIMTSIYIVREDYIDIYKNEHRQFRHKFDNMSGLSSFIEDSKNKSFALEHKFKIYKFELNDNFRLTELEKELGI